ncbi:cell division protein FtsZ [Caldiplasma sukawensis]
MSVLDSELDDKIEEYNKSSLVRIAVLGIGGAGCNVIEDMEIKGKLNGVIKVGINTEAISMREKKIANKIVIGMNSATKGRGSGNDPQKGKEAAIEDDNKLENLIKKFDLVFLICGMGGGTGTGATPEIARMAKKNNVMTMCFVTMPLNNEGEQNKVFANMGVEELKKYCNTIFEIKNQKISEIYRERRNSEVYEIANDFIINQIENISELIRKPSLINIDFNDFARVAYESGEIMTGSGTGTGGEERIKFAIENSLKNSIIDYDCTDARGVLVKIEGSDLKVKELKEILKILREKTGPNSEIIYGLDINEQMKGAVKITIVMSGVKSNEINSGLRKEEEAIPSV